MYFYVTRARKMTLELKHICIMMCGILKYTIVCWCTFPIALKNAKTEVHFYLDGRRSGWTYVNISVAGIVRRLHSTIKNIRQNVNRHDSRKIDAIKYFLSALPDVRCSHCAIKTHGIVIAAASVLHKCKGVAIASRRRPTWPESGTIGSL